MYLLPNRKAKAKRSLSFYGREKLSQWIQLWRKEGTVKEMK